MLEDLPKMLLGISQKFPLLCLNSFLLCSIMLTVITAVSYVYVHIISSINCVYSFELVTAYTTVLWL